MNHLALILLGLITAIGATSHAANYGEALQKSIYFYEAQQSGPLPAWNRNEWRGDSGMQDGDDSDVDLRGGWYDAGDHVKFGFPMASATTLLAWGVVDYRQAYVGTQQLHHIQNNLRFVADYFVKAHTAPNELWGQVGAGAIDHAWWGAAEVMPMTRPSFKIDSQCPGSDLAGETAAALAAVSMVFKSSDALYANSLLTHAEQLYQFADRYRGKYSDCITDARAFYNSWSGYQDELVWAAIWLYRATGKTSYLDKAKTEYNLLSNENGSTVKSFKWTQAWDDKSYGSYVLMSKLTNEPLYRADAERWLDYWTTGYQGQRVRYTPGGLAYLDQWGAARYSANTSFIALVYADHLRSINANASKQKSYYDFAVAQMEYLLGKNPRQSSYVIGYGNNFPSAPHHRTSHGSWNDSIQEPLHSRHTLIGALVGGPDSNDGFLNDRGDYVLNEVATDYNAGFTSALARLWLDFGGEPIAESQFPSREARDVELFVEAKANSLGTRHTEISAKVHNHSAWPARSTNNLKMRYWVDLSEVIAAGYSARDVKLSSAYSQASGLSGLHRWGDASKNIYYAEISFANVKIYPGGQSASKKEVQFRLAVPELSAWDNRNDPSWDNYGGNSHIAANKIALYDGERLVWGQEPTPACGGSSGINCPPEAHPQQISTAFETPVNIVLSASDSDGNISAYNLTSQAQHGSLSGNGNRFSYTPNRGFSGEDQFSFNASDNVGALSTPATVNITVAPPVQPGVTIQSPTADTSFAPGAAIAVRYSLQHISAVNVYIDDRFIRSDQGTGVITLNAPSPLGFHTITLIATNAQGQELPTRASVRINVVDTPPSALKCDLNVIDVWNTGFVLNNVTVTNTGSQPISQWRVQLQFPESIQLVNGWNGQFETSVNGRTVTVSNMAWNGSLSPGQSTTFGMQGNHDGSFERPQCRQP